MKKRFDKEDALGLLIIIGGIILICGWIFLFLGIPIWGIKDAFKIMLGMSKDKTFVIFGIVCALSGAGIAYYFIYNKIIDMVQNKITVEKNKKVKLAISTGGIVLLIFITVIFLINYIVFNTEIILFLFNSLVWIYAIELVFFALIGLLIIIDYTNKKLK